MMPSWISWCRHRSSRRALADKLPRSAAARPHRGLQRQRCLRQQFHRQRRKALMRFAPVQLRKAAPGADRVTGDQRIDRRLDMRLQHVDIDHGLGELRSHSALRPAGRPSTGSVLQAAIRWRSSFSKRQARYMRLVARSIASTRIAAAQPSSGAPSASACATSTLSKKTSQKLSRPSIDLMVRRARRSIQRHREQRQSAMAVLDRPGARQQQAALRAIGAAGPDLLAVDAPDIAVANRARPQACEVGAGFRLRESLAPDVAHIEDGRKEAHFCASVPIGEDDRTGKLLADRIDTFRRRQRADFLVGDEMLTQGAAVPAVSRGPGDARKSCPMQRCFPGDRLSERRRRKGWAVAAEAFGRLAASQLRAACR